MTKLNPHTNKTSFMTKLNPPIHPLCTSTTNKVNLTTTNINHMWERKGKIPMLDRAICGRARGVIGGQRPPLTQRVHVCAAREAVVGGGSGGSPSGSSPSQ